MAGSQAQATTTIAATASIWNTCGHSCWPRNRNWRTAFDLSNDSPTRKQFLARLEKEIGTRGVIDVLRNGIKHGPHDLTLFYGTPSPGNAKAVERYAANRFSVTRQLRYSRDETQLALDLGLFINGLPVATFELKNSLTKQTVEDAVEQYKRDRDPRELLFQFGRCVVHFAVDDQRGAVLHGAEGQERRGSCRSTRVGTTAPATRRTRRTQDRLPVEAHPHAGGPDRHPGELRPDRRGEGPEDRQEEARRRSSRATTSSTSSASSWPTSPRTASGSAT